MRKLSLFRTIDSDYFIKKNRIKIGYGFYRLHRIYFINLQAIQASLVDLAVYLYFKIAF